MGPQTLPRGCLPLSLFLSLWEAGSSPSGGGKNSSCESPFLFELKILICLCPLSFWFHLTSFHFFQCLSRFGWPVRTYELPREGRQVWMGKNLD